MENKINFIRICKYTGLNSLTKKKNATGRIHLVALSKIDFTLYQIWDYAKEDEASANTEVEKTKTKKKKRERLEKGNGLTRVNVSL